MGVGSRIKHAWNAFQGTDDFGPSFADIGASYGVRPDRPRFRLSTERSIIASIYTRLSLDVAGIPIRHVRVDDNEQYAETIQSGLNNCLKVEANLDQGARAFRQDMAQTLFEQGTIAIVPVDTSLNPNVTGGYDVKTLRVGTIVAWYPRHVRVSVFNQDKGIRQEITLEKSFVAIVENPLYSVMNEPNSTLQRLILKLGQLDAVDQQSSSGKLDLIIQLPYVIKSEARREQAEKRRKDIEFQLSGSQYGIAYTDGTEKITQLNRPVTNSLMEQVTYLTNMLYSQLGLTEEIMNGTADAATMQNYENRTLVPVLDAICEAMARTFLTSTARSQQQTIQYFQDVFRFVPIADIAEIADKFSRNEIMSPNEIRSVIGFRPSKDPKADQLMNSNMPQPALDADPIDPNQPDPQEQDLNQQVSDLGIT